MTILQIKEIKKSMLALEKNTNVLARSIITLIEKINTLEKECQNKKRVTYLDMRRKI